VFGIDPLTASALLILASGGNPLCQMPKSAEINVIPKSHDVVYDYSKSLADLQGTETGTINPYGFGGISIHQGFAHNPVQVSTKVSLDFKQLQGYPAACVWYDKIDIIMTITPKVTIAREIKKDRCRGKAVLEHEMKHVMVARIIANKYAKAIGRKVYDGLKQRGFIAGPVELENMQATADRMQKTVYQIIEHQNRKMEIDYIEMQEEVDSLEEYERVSDICKDTPSPTAAFIEKSRKKSRRSR